MRKYKIKQGFITIINSDKNLSTGTLELNPGQELKKHKRPILESLNQLEGKCVMKIFNDESIEKEITLNKGDTIDIKPETYHIHSNPFNEKSIILWEFIGDITNIINEIQVNNNLRK